MKQEGRRVAGMAAGVLIVYVLAWLTLVAGVLVLIRWILL